MLEVQVDDDHEVGAIAHFGERRRIPAATLLHPRERVQALAMQVIEHTAAAFGEIDASPQAVDIGREPAEERAPRALQQPRRRGDGDFQGGGPPGDAGFGSGRHARQRCARAWADGALEREAQVGTRARFDVVTEQCAMRADDARGMVGLSLGHDGWGHVGWRHAKDCRERQCWMYGFYS